MLYCLDGFECFHYYGSMTLFSSVIFYSWIGFFLSGLLYMWFRLCSSGLLVYLPGLFCFPSVHFQPIYIAFIWIKFFSFSLLVNRFGFIRQLSS